MTAANDHAHDYEDDSDARLKPSGVGRSKSIPTGNSPHSEGPNDSSGLATEKIEDLNETYQTLTNLKMTPQQKDKLLTNAATIMEFAIRIRSPGFKTEIDNLYKYGRGSANYSWKRTVGRSDIKFGFNVYEGSHRLAEDRPAAPAEMHSAVVNTSPFARENLVSSLRTAACLVAFALIFLAAQTAVTAMLLGRGNQKLDEVNQRLTLVDERTKEDLPPKLVQLDQLGEQYQSLEKSVNSLKTPRPVELSQKSRTELAKSVESSITSSLGPFESSLNSLTSKLNEVMTPPAAPAAAPAATDPAPAPPASSAASRPMKIDKIQFEELSGQLKAISTASSKIADDVAKKIPRPPEVKVPTTEELAKGLKAALKQEFDDFRVALSPRKGDIWVVGLHTTSLDQSHFRNTLTEALRAFPRGPNASVRMGFLLAETSNLTPVVPLTEPNPNLSRLGPAAAETTEFPQGFGVDLDRRFDRDRPKQCVILIASPSCQPLLAQDAGWEVIPEIHVVLIAKTELNREQRDRLLEWHRFVQSHLGTLRVILPDDVRRQNDQLKRELVNISQIALP